MKFDKQCNQCLLKPLPRFQQHSQRSPSTLSPAPSVFSCASITARETTPSVLPPSHQSNPFFRAAGGCAGKTIVFCTDREMHTFSLRERERGERISPAGCLHEKHFNFDVFSPFEMETREEWMGKPERSGWEESERDEGKRLRVEGSDVER